MYKVGTEACACLDTSRRRFAPPSQAHATNRKNGTNENPKPSDAESSAKPLGRSSAFTLGGFWDFFGFYTVFQYGFVGGEYRFPAKEYRFVPLRPLVFWVVFLLSLYCFVSIRTIRISHKGNFVRKQGRKMRKPKHKEQFNTIYKIYSNKKSIIKIKTYA